jgi:O-antigen/teichoic acid export membrane protein
VTATPQAPERSLGTRLRDATRDGGAIAAAIVMMNVATYAFQMVAARVLGPEQYGGVSALMALFLVVAVVQLGLQATAARRIAADPDDVEQIERVMLKVTYRAGWLVGAVLLLLSPVVWQVLRLDSIVPALLLAAGAVPLTIMGGQAGVLQGERRWVPLALVYLSLGVPRLVLGTAAILIRPTEGAAMAGVAAAMVVPVAVGWWALRGTRSPGADNDHNRIRPTVREAVSGSLALMAFFVLSNVDIVIARNVLPAQEAGLYAGGLILTKAVLFLPQFVVVVAFPAMSTVAERRRALLRSLAAGVVLGGGCVLGALVLADLATFFVGGSEYAEVSGRLWAFAAVGTLLALLQLLVYSVLARQGTASTYLTWGAAVVLVGIALLQDAVNGLLLTVAGVDAVLLVVLLAMSLRHMKHDQAPAPAP